VAATRAARCTLPTVAGVSWAVVAWCSSARNRLGAALWRPSWTRARGGSARERRGACGFGPDHLEAGDGAQ